MATEYKVDPERDLKMFRMKNFGYQVTVNTKCYWNTPAKDKIEESKRKQVELKMNQLATMFMDLATDQMDSYIRRNLPIMLPLPGKGEL